LTDTLGQQVIVENGRGDCSAWAAFVYPKGTPEAIVRRLAKPASETLDRASVRARLETVGVTIPAPERRSPEYLARHIP